jgi:hypothetical protein
MVCHLVVGWIVCQWLSADSASSGMRQSVRDPQNLRKTRILAAQFLHRLKVVIY